MYWRIRDVGITLFFFLFLRTAFIQRAWVNDLVFIYYVLHFPPNFEMLHLRCKYFSFLQNYVVQV